MKALSFNLYHSRGFLAERRAAKNRDRLAYAIILAAFGISVAGAVFR